MIRLIIEMEKNMQFNEIVRSLEKTISGEQDFFDHVLLIVSQGVDTYQINLKEGEAYYLGKETQEIVVLPKKIIYPTGAIWNAEQIKRAVIAIQNKQVSFTKFLEQLSRAGVLSYIFDLSHYNMHYLGLKDLVYTEKFPSSFAQKIDQLKLPV